MNFMTIALGTTGLALLGIFIWMASLSAKKRRLTAEKEARDKAYRRAIERQREEEQKERIYKAETGHVQTQLFLAKEAERTNPREALYWYEQAAMQDNEMGMYGIVRVCARASQDVVLAEKAKFWQLAIDAAEGSEQAKFDMGKALLGGQGVEQNIDKGIECIESLANQGNIEAQVFMGDWYVADSNMSPNPKLSSEWLYKAAEHSSIEGQIKLAKHYLEGIGVKKDILRATYWFEIAAEQGSAEAQFYAGECWADRGTKGDAMAYLWLFLSAHFGYEPAKHRRDDIGNIIGVEGVISIQGMAKPLIKKFKGGPLAKHSMINALNKLYKRENYLPERDGNEFMVYEPNDQVASESDADDLIFDNEATDADSASVEVKGAEGVNYSVSPMDKH